METTWAQLLALDDDVPDEYVDGQLVVIPRYLRLQIAAYCFEALLHQGLAQSRGDALRCPACRPALRANECMTVADGHP